jgi:hypothetical protein
MQSWDERKSVFCELLRTSDKAVLTSIGEHQESKHWCIKCQEWDFEPVQENKGFKPETIGEGMFCAIQLYSKIYLR